MEYTVGSVADLISGNSTSEKIRIVKKEIINTSVDSMLGSSPNKVRKVKKLKKKKKSNVEKTNSDRMVVINPEDIEALDEEQGSENESAEIDDGEQGSGVESGDEDNKETQPKKEIDPAVKAEQDARTVFVGNVPVTVSKDKLMRHFRPYGLIESVRVRSVAPENPMIDTRTVGIRNLVHKKRKSVNAYVVFKKQQDALKSLVLNGTKFEDHYLRVTKVEISPPSAGKAIFIGQLDFEAEDNDLWETFEGCGEIESVRVVRGKFGVGAGVGYVNFKSADSVELALQMEDVKIGKRICRIYRCNNNPKNKKVKSNNEFVGRKKKEVMSFKKFGTSKKGSKTVNDGAEVKKHLEGKSFKNFGPSRKFPKAARDGNVPRTEKNGSDVKKPVYRGRVAQKLNKKKYNKEMAQKLKLAGKVAPRAAAK